MADAPASALPCRAVPAAAGALFIFFSLAVLLTGLVSMLFADLLWRTGWTVSSTVLLVLFVILFLLTSIGCMHGIFGFSCRTCGRSAPDHRAWRITGHDSIDGTSTAIIFPIYNEDVGPRLRRSARHL